MQEWLIGWDDDVGCSFKAEPVAGAFWELLENTSAEAIAPS